MLHGVDEPISLIPRATTPVNSLLVCIEPPLHHKGVQLCVQSGGAWNMYSGKDKRLLLVKIKLSPFSKGKAGNIMLPMYRKVIFFSSMLHYWTTNTHTLCLYVGD